MNKNELILSIVNNTTGIPLYYFSVIGTLELRGQIRKIEFCITGYSKTFRVWYDKSRKQYVHNLDAYTACYYGLSGNEYVSENYYEYL